MTAKRPPGQPTKLTPKMKGQIKLLALKGFTDVEMAIAVGVDEQTINNWKKKSPKFFGSLKDWKAQADSKVEKSLRQRALGYEVKETTQKPKVVKDEAGNVISSEMVVTKEVTKQVIPDTTAQIFWLKNRKREEWSDTKDVNVTLADLGDRLTEAHKRTE